MHRPIHQRARSRAVALFLPALALLAAAATPASAKKPERSLIGSFSQVTNLGSTVPGDGDENPYGIVNVPKSAGSLVAGDILISNFNNSENLQGTGTTIVQMTPGGQLSQFAEIKPSSLPGECPGGVGLTTALAILPKGFVVVGSLPTSNGVAETAQAGCLIVLDSAGHVVQTISGEPIDGPWDMTSVSHGSNTTLFVTNVLNGTVASGETPTPGGTVVRIGLRITGDRAPVVTSKTVIGTGFDERTDKAALVIGPTGVALGGDGTLYVADTQNSRVAAIPDALDRSTPLGGGGQTIATADFLNKPLGMTLAPNGDLLTANGGDGNIVETTPAGVELQPFDTGAGEGGLFGLTVTPARNGVYLVNDSNNTLGLAR